ncbi:MAG: GatB/YqeY domain-containing protein [Burkholderiaceae bacterium]
MSLKDRLQEDIKAAMRAKAADQLTTLRLITAAIKQKEVDERVTLDDAQVLSVIEKMVKQRKDSIAQFQAGGRQDLVEKESAELALLQSYLPAQLSEAEIRAEVDAGVDALLAAGETVSPALMGKVMAQLKPRLAGRADMGVVSRLIKEALSSR